MKDALDEKNPEEGEGKETDTTVDDSKEEDGKDEEQTEPKEEPKDEPIVSADVNENEEEEKTKTEGEEADEEEEKDVKRKGHDKNEKEQKSEKQPFGVKEKQMAGQDSDAKMEDNADEEDKNDKMDSSQNQQVGADDILPELQGEWRASETPQSSSGAAKKQKQSDPNPYRSTGDAQKHWEERLQVMDLQQKGEQDEASAAENDVNQQDDKQEDENNQSGDGVFEFMKENQRDKNERQALGASKEHNEESLPTQKQDEEGDEETNKTADEQPLMQDEEEDKMDVEEDKNRQPDDASAESKEAKMAEKSSSAKNRYEQKKPQDVEPTVDSMDIDKQAVTDDNGRLDAEAIMNVSSDQLGTDGISDSTSQTEKKDWTAEEMQRMREELNLLIANWESEENNADKGLDLWKRFEAVTSHLSQQLCEQLRMILEPLLATKLAGDYKSGKRINMKKVIPYIASNFRKDKIWMRRTKPSKRQYQVMVAIDDSRSMFENKVGPIALEALTTICQGMTKLEVGQLAIASFGEKFQVVHAFDQPFTEAAGSYVISQFAFDQQSDVSHNKGLAIFLESAIQYLDLSKHTQGAGGGEHTQLLFIITDARFNKETVRKWVREAQERGQLIVLLIVDCFENSSDSIMNAKEVNYPNGKMQITPYLDDFPFPYYIVLKSINALPETLADVLRQWFEYIQRAT
eukprot:GILJ01012633.1.p1 GENE.GILJ01012633.1~~GILJ01012633.1.p1  ORF type:complete len:759 (-),score=234.04 GILJ01012633.1:49-2112(-)